MIIASTEIHPILASGPKSRSATDKLTGKVARPINKRTASSGAAEVGAPKRKKKPGYYEYD